MAQCGGCKQSITIVYAELVRSTNTQSEIVDVYHCPPCYRTHPKFRERASKLSIAALPKIVAGASERSQALWHNPEYREKCEANAAALSKSAEFSAAVSAAMVKKFAEDGVYRGKVQTARRSYWLNDDYRIKRMMSVDEFVQRAKLVHGDRYDYSEVVLEGTSAKVNIICKSHGIFHQRPSHHLHYKNGCPQCAWELTKSSGEVELTEWLSSLGHATECNRRDVLPFDYEVDIFIPTVKVAIEYHGIYWHSYNHNETVSQKYRHHRKSSLAAAVQIKLLQFYDSEWNNKQDIVKSMIVNNLGQSERIGARSCQVEVADEDTAKSFFNDNHLGGYRKADVTIGLVHGSKLVSMMSFSKRGNGVFEVMRLATAIGYSVSGGIGKMLKCFINLTNPSKIFTYANRRYSTANGYRAVGFVQRSITKPDYYYIYNNKVINRQRFQKYKLARLLPNFDRSLTEAQNMFNNGYRRLWGAGHYYLEWTNENR